jgi:Ca-activated chloride channel family protein
MFSLRSSRAARHPAAPLPAPRSLVSFLNSLPSHLAVTLAMSSLTGMTSLTGCSSAGDTYIDDPQTTAAATEASSSASVGDSGQTVTGQGGTGGGTADPGSETDGADEGPAGSTGTGEPPPMEEPELGDIVTQQLLDGNCDPVTPVSIGLRALDAAATVSPTLARDAALSGWVSLSGIRIRPWEFFNYYSFDYPPAEPGLVTVTPHLSHAPGDELWHLQVGIATEALPAELRPPLHLTLALDNSNSMAGKAQDMLRATGKAIAGSLRQGDTLSIVTWNAKTATVLELHPISGPNDPLVLDKLDQLEIGGSAELYSGLMAAYKLAEAAHDPAHWNRVVLVSDGGATATETDLGVIAEQAQKPSGIYLSGVGVGDPGNYRSDLMDAAAHAGRGASLFVGSVEEADKRFGPQFVRTLGAAVRDIDVQIDLPPGFALVRDSAADKLNDPLLTGSLRLAPNASLVLHRSLSNCTTLDPAAKLLVRVGFIDEATGESREVKTAVKLETLLAEQPAALAKGSALQAYASALQRWQVSPADLATALTTALDRLAAALSLLPNDPELAEIAKVLTVLGEG